MTFVALCWPLIMSEEEKEIAHPPLQGEYIESIDALHIRLGKAFETFCNNFNKESQGNVYEHKEDGDDPLA